MKAKARMPRPLPPVKMMVPYSPDEGERIGRCLTGLGVGSLGPCVGSAMLRIAEGIEKVIASDHRLDAGMMQVLAEYREKLLDVCRVEAGAQAEAIAVLQRLVGKAKGGGQ